MTPVCTPDIAGQLNVLDDLSKFTLLFDAPLTKNHEPTWEFWAKQVNYSLPRIKRKRSFATSKYGDPSRH